MNIRNPDFTESILATALVANALSHSSTGTQPACARPIGPCLPTRNVCEREQESESERERDEKGESSLLLLLLYR